MAVDDAVRLWPSCNPAPDGPKCQAQRALPKGAPSSRPTTMESTVTVAARAIQRSSSCRSAIRKASPRAAVVIKGYRCRWIFRHPSGSDIRAGPLWLPRASGARGLLGIKRTGQACGYPPIDTNVVPVANIAQGHAWDGGWMTTAGIPLRMTGSPGMLPGDFFLPGPIPGVPGSPLGVGTLGPVYSTADALSAEFQLRYRSGNA